MTGTMAAANTNKPSGITEFAITYCCRWQGTAGEERGEKREREREKIRMQLKQ